jgi:hypothetical protein
MGLYFYVSDGLVNEAGFYIRLLLGNMACLLPVAMITTLECAKKKYEPYFPLQLVAMGSTVALPEQSGMAR